MIAGGKINKNMEKEKITFEQFCDPEYRRKQQMQLKSEAVWVVFHELDGLLNVSKFAKRYFNKTQSWFAQKLSGMTVCNKKRAFTPDEYSAISASLRDIAKRLNDYADEIDKAKNE